MTKGKMFRWIVALIVLCSGAVQGAPLPADFESVKDQAVFTPTPEFFRSLLDNAYYVFLLSVDSKTGSVTNVQVKESTGGDYYRFKILESLRRWRFKPGAPALIQVSFGMERVWTGDPDHQRHTKAVNDLLEPFLGKQAVRSGALPDYPTKPPWPNKRGTAVFELHVAKSGAVTKVNLKRASGDEAFDQNAAAVLARWYFRKGPVVVELPLSFVLTPEKFSLYVPKNT
jgi:TonB family protein